MVLLEMENPVPWQFQDTIIIKQIKLLQIIPSFEELQILMVVLKYQVL